MNNQNLKPILFEKGSERAREAGRKGGYAAAAANKRRREIRETMEILLNMPIKKGQLKDIEQLKCIKDLKDKNITTQDAIVFALIKTALSGGTEGVSAFKEIQNTLNQGNDVATLNVNIIDSMTKDELIKLAEIDEKLSEDQQDDEYEEEQED